MSATWIGFKFQDAAAALGNGNVLNPRVSTASTLAFYVAISNTATVTFEATVDGTTWTAVQATNLNTGSAATSATASGLFRMDATGLTGIRMRVSAFTNGTVTVTGNLCDG